MNEESTPQSHITRGMVVLGDVVFEGHLVLDGRVCGNVVSRDGAFGEISVLPNGCVEGNLRVQMAVIGGKVHGAVQAVGQATLLAGAHIRGDVRYSVVDVQMGAYVGGRFIREDSESSGNVVIFKSTALDGSGGGPP